MQYGLLSVICVVGLNCVVSAGPIYNNLSSASAGTQMPNIRNALGDSFSTGASAATLNSISLLLTGFPDPFGSFKVYLASDSGMRPGAILYTTPLVLDGVFRGGGALQVLSFTIPGGYQLSADTRYWILLFGATTAEWSFPTDQHALGVAGEYWFSEHTGSHLNFSTPGTGPFQMAINTPEPGTLLLFGVGVLIVMGSPKRGPTDFRI
jgi:hypothetical protein